MAFDYHEKLFVFVFILSLGCVAYSANYTFFVVSTSTFLAACNDLKTYYTSAKLKYGEYNNITCLSYEIADQLKLANTTNASTIALKTTTGANLTAAEVGQTVLFLMRTPLVPQEETLLQSSFRQFPVIVNCILIGYNIPELTAKGEVFRLTQDNLVGIFSGTIKFWNDTRLLVNNTALRAPNGSSILPGKRITLGFRLDRYLSTWVLTRTLSSISPGWAKTYGNIQDGTVFSTTVKGPKTWLTNKMLGISLYGFLKDTPYSMIIAPQEDVEKYGFDVVRVQNSQGKFTKCTELTINGGIEAASSSYAARVRNGSMENLNGTTTYPLLGFSYVGLSLTKLGQRDQLFDCTILSGSLRFLNWILDASNQESQQILTNNYYIRCPAAWYPDLWSLQQDLRCGDRKQLVQRYLDSIQSTEDTYELLHSTTFWAYLICGLLAGLAVAAYVGKQAYIYLNRLRRENMEQYAISSKMIRITPSVYSPMDRFKGVVASRKVVDRYIPTASLQCLATGTWGEYEVFLRPCSLMLHRLNHRTRMQMLKLMEISSQKNIVEFYGMTEVPGGRCLVCNFCPFGDLRTLVISKKHIFSMNTKFSLSGDIAEGMEYLHDCDVVHGNLRSCAVYIEANWTARISDFEYDTLHQVQGSFHPTVAQLKQKLNLYQQTSLYPWLYWTAPEILRQGITGREIPPEKSADIYSFGIVCSEIFAMEPAYQKYQELPYKLTPAQILNGILSADMRPREDWKTTATPKCVLRVMEHCWQENASRRPSFATLRKLLRSVRSLRRHVADKIMIAAEKTAEAVKSRCDTASDRLNRFDQEFHKYSKILVPPAYWRSIYKQKLYMSMTRHKLGIVFYCNLVEYGNLINEQTTSRAFECINLLHEGFQNLIDKGGRVYRVYRNGTGFVALGNVPYGVKEDPIDSIAHLAFDFLTWAWRVKLPGHLMDGFQLQIGIHSGPLTAGTLKHSTNHFIPLGPVQKEAWDIVRSSAPCRILISEDFHQNLRQLAQIFIKYRIVPNTGRVFGYSKKTYWLVGMNYYRGQSLLDDMFLLDPDNLEAAAKLAAKKEAQTKDRKGNLRNELVKVVSALPFDYQALTAGGAQYVVDVKEKEKRRSQAYDRKSFVHHAGPLLLPSMQFDEIFERKSHLDMEPSELMVHPTVTSGNHPRYVAGPKKVHSVEDTDQQHAGRHSPETEKALKRLRAIKKKEITDMEHKRQDEAARTHLHHELLEATGSDERLQEDLQDVNQGEPPESKADEKTEYYQRYSDVHRPNQRHRHYYDDGDEEYEEAESAEEVYGQSDEYFAGENYEDDQIYYDPEVVTGSLQFMRESEILSDQMENHLAQMAQVDFEQQQVAYDTTYSQTSIPVTDAHQPNETIIDVVPDEKVKRKKKKSKKRRKHKEATKDEDE